MESQEFGGLRAATATNQNGCERGNLVCFPSHRVRPYQYVRWGVSTNGHSQCGHSDRSPQTGKQMGGGGCLPVAVLSPSLSTGKWISQAFFANWLSFLIEILAECWRAGEGTASSLCFQLYCASFWLSSPPRLSYCQTLPAVILTSIQWPELLYFGGLNILVVTLQL